MGSTQDPAEQDVSVYSLSNFLLNKDLDNWFLNFIAGPLLKKRLMELILIVNNFAQNQCLNHFVNQMFFLKNFLNKSQTSKFFQQQCIFNDLYDYWNWILKNGKVKKYVKTHKKMCWLTTEYQICQIIVDRNENCINSDLILQETSSRV